MAKGPKPNQYNRYKRPEHSSGRMKTMFNTLIGSGITLALILGADHAVENWTDKKVSNTPHAPDITIPVEVPPDTYGVVPYPDAPHDEVRTVKKPLPVADGVIWEQNGSKSVRPSIVVAKKETVDVILDELRAEAEEELKRLRQTKGSAPTNVTTSGETSQTEEISEITIATPQPAPAQSDEQPISYYNGKPKRLPEFQNPGSRKKEVQTPKQKKEPVIKQHADPKPQKKGDLRPAPSGDIKIKPQTQLVAAATLANKIVVKYKIPDPEADAYLRQITKGDPVSYELMLNIGGSESGFKDVCSPTGACGYFQFTEGTFIERAYLDQGLLDPKHKKVLSKIIQYDYAALKEQQRVALEHAQGNKKATVQKVDAVYKYRIAGNTPEERAANRAKILELRHDKFVSLRTGHEHVRSSLIDARGRFVEGIIAKIDCLTDKTKHPVVPKERVEQLRAELERPFTIADAKLAFLGGGRGGTGLVVAMADPATANHKASDYISQRTVTSNPHVFVVNEKHLTPLQLRAYIVERVGDMQIPSNLQRPNSSKPQRPATTRTTQAPGADMHFDIS